MRRLYRQIYLTIIASLLLVVLVAGLVWRLAPTVSPAQQAFEMAGELAAAALPPASEGQSAQQSAIARLHDRLRIDLALFDRDGRLIAAAGNPLPVPRTARDAGWLYGRGGPAWSIRLPDERWIVARAPPRFRRPAFRFLIMLAGVALAIAICAYPLVRGLTRRLERLQMGVDQLGGGDLSARVEVKGKDEVARLAQSFNRAAERIEQLVGAHKLLLAHTSHELRTPLARIRLGVELMKDDPSPQRRANLEQDIAELDALIEEILLSSRLDASNHLDRVESVDLLALAAEESARYPDCTVTGEPVSVRGDRALLKRMVRNLIDNAEKHGAPPIEVEVRRQGATASLTVRDAGKGVSMAERERIFQPFYRVTGGERPRGTGLGLTLVRQIARQHGGDVVWLDSPERTSALRVTLPLPGKVSA